MKILVICSHGNMGRATKQVLTTLKEVDVVETDHEKAMMAFLSEEPDAVLIYDYEETGSGLQDYNKGRRTYSDINNSANNDVIVVRCGLSNYDYPDYVKLPFELPNLFKALGI